MLYMASSGRLYRRTHGPFLDVGPGNFITLAELRDQLLRIGIRGISLEIIVDTRKRCRRCRQIPHEPRGREVTPLRAVMPAKDEGLPQCVRYHDSMRRYPTIAGPCNRAASASAAHSSSRRSPPRAAAPKNARDGVSASYGYCSENRSRPKLMVMRGPQRRNRGRHGAQKKPCSVDAKLLPGRQSCGERPRSQDGDCRELVWSRRFSSECASMPLMKRRLRGARGHFRCNDGRSLVSRKVAGVLKRPRELEAGRTRRSWRQTCRGYGASPSRPPLLGERGPPASLMYAPQLGP